ncbi:MAG TPA: recombinase family protein [Humisphaera sp.]|nr:recombinase family protein [Humisphaera sp.]
MIQNNTIKNNDIAVALYARVSSQQQLKDGTIQSQVDAIRRRIADDGMRIEESACYIDDGYGGSTLVRPAMERLRDVADTGAIGRLYVLSPDRLSRDYAYQVALVDELRRCGVEIVFLNHDLARSPEGDMLLQVQGIVAQYERAQIMEARFSTSCATPFTWARRLTDERTPASGASVRVGDPARRLKPLRRSRSTGQSWLTRSRPRLG